VTATGYAGSAVARACLLAFERGKDFCTLYADLDNATSTGLYQRLGFELLVETADVVFEPRGE
jgi:predicted GNAT family acetyltransferase